MSFEPSFEIGSKRVGAGAPVFVIAEAGIAHFGDLQLAHQLVDLAIGAGADAFKVQLFDVDALVARRAVEWRDRLRSRSLTFAQAAELKRRCDAAGIVFLATAHDETRVAWLEALDVPAVKVGSGERNNPAFVRRLASLGLPMIVSTGMHSEDDVREALTACIAAENARVALLHCVTSYPTPPEDVSLASMQRLRAVFSGPVGYSDHTADGLAVLAAVALGASIVEKHVTILRDVPNAQDWKVSEDAEGFRRLVADIRRVEQLIGNPAKQLAPCEIPAQIWATKSLVAATRLNAGDVLKTSDLVAKRPGDGIHPSRIGELVGRRLRRSIEADDAIRLDDLV